MRKIFCYDKGMRMNLTILLVLAALGLSACANTLDGVRKDASRAGDKAQAISTIITEP